METRTNIYIGIGAGVLGLLISGLIYWGVSQHRQLSIVYEAIGEDVSIEDWIELMAIEKDELEEQYADLYEQFDGFQQLDIRNDSLQDQLAREQQRVQDLLEELRQTKASNARQITKLKNELAEVRAVTQDLIRQIDSLNVTNARLVAENQQMKLENKQFKQENTQLTNQNNELKETVSRASMLEINSLTLTKLDKNDRKTSLQRKLHKLQFNFEIAKNITCKPGITDLYACIIDPQGKVLGASEYKVFRLENKDQPYSLLQQFEYAGEEYKGVCYFTLEEGQEIKKGDYFIDFFCDGNMIGSYSFQLRK